MNTDTVKDIVMATFLGPYGATFSGDAYTFGARKLDPTGNCLPRDEQYFDLANSNSQILPKVCAHGGYGVIAMETLAEGKITEPNDSFVVLLQKFDQHNCPIQIIGSHEMDINFCLMTRKGVKRENITKVVSHPKSFGACKKKVAALGTKCETVDSNGEAARMIKEEVGYEYAAAIGPYSAATKYGLEVHNFEFQDEIAITTFYMLGPRKHPCSLGLVNRALVVFEVNHVPNALAKVLSLFGEMNINLTKIHSTHVRNGTYHFSIELEILIGQIRKYEFALEIASQLMTNHIAFGPFEIISANHKPNSVPEVLN